MRARNDFEILCSHLTFTRENVHSSGKKTAAYIKQAMKQIDATHLAPGDERTEFYAKLCRQVGIYFLFHAREKATAHRYLLQYQTLSAGELLDYAEACNLKGTASVIDSECQNSVPFEAAQNIYEQLAKDKTNNTNIDLISGQAFALRSLSLTAQRNNNLQKALSFLQDANKIQNTYANSLAGQIDTAEALHIFSLILIHQKNYPEAEKKLIEAIQIWESLSKQTGHPYPMMYVTMQTYANVLRFLHKYEEAKDLLHHVYISQIIHHRKEKHSDIANTLQLSGEVLEDMQHPEEAYFIYQQAHKIKLALQYSENSGFLHVTQESIKRIRKKMNLSTETSPSEASSSSHPSFWNKKTNLIEKKSEEPTPAGQSASTYKS